MKKKILLSVISISLLNAETFNVSTTPELRDALEISATNGENDTITLADGTYKTTDDGKGTFIYLSNEENNLILKGSSSDNVILSGDNKEQILNFNSTEYGANLTVEKLSFVDGNISVFVDSDINVSECKFSNNIGYIGGGFYATGNVLVKNSIFYKNHVMIAGGGFYTPKEAKVYDSEFIENKTKYEKPFTSLQDNEMSGAGFVAKDIFVENSSFKNNLAYTGAGFSAYKSVYTYKGSSYVKNCSFENNSAYLGAGFISRVAIINKSSFKDNNATFRGAGFMTSDSVGQSNTYIEDSLFLNNQSEEGAGFYIWKGSNLKLLNSQFKFNKAKKGAGFFSLADKSLIVHNSIFIHNIAEETGGAFYTQYDNLKASNLLIISNSSGIDLSGENNIIINSIFKDNNDFDIDIGKYSIVSNLENNYIDLSKISTNNFDKNNIFDGVNLGFVDEENGDYHLTSNSDLIDRGTTNIDIKVTVCQTKEEAGKYDRPHDGCEYGTKILITDLDGNQRVSGGSIDIGPYEFSSTKPTINDITSTGEAKVFSELSFSADYSLFDGKNLASIEYDFENSGNFVTTNSYSFSSDGIKTIKVKITDSDGEYSIFTKEITISPIAFEDMSLEQKIKSLTNDENKIESILSNINNNQYIYTQEDLDNKLETTKNYCKNNPKECGIEIDKNLIYTQEDLDNKEAIKTLTKNYIDNLNSGWHILGSSYTIEDKSIFENIENIWSFRANEWIKNPDTLNENEGFWVKKQIIKTLECNDYEILQYKIDGSTYCELNPIYSNTNIYDDMLPINETGNKVIISFNNDSVSIGDGVWMADDVIIKGDTGVVKLNTGSSFLFNITNNMNRDFIVNKFEFINVYNNTYTTKMVSTDSSLLNNGFLNSGETLSLGYTFTAPQTANYWIGRYYLTDIITGKSFTNSYTWDGSTW